MPRVDIRANEPLEKALRRFKRKIEREGILRQLRARKHYEKPSEVKRRKKREARSKSKRRF
ncbi:MAG: 30S ribosomal protein S21 [Candidatus Omnitrophica bacterium]|nr:30S ribosomal protein S21 [Candidatus Omnitrophota bacterium]